jgi:hypothetical protein
MLIFNIKNILKNNYPILNTLGPRVKIVFNGLKIGV